MHGVGEQVGHLNLAGNEKVLHSGAVAVVEACMVQPNAKLQAVPEVSILHAATSLSRN